VGSKNSAFEPVLPNNSHSNVSMSFSFKWNAKVVVNKSGDKVSNILHWKMSNEDSKVTALPIK
jgi:hypothetical protein